VKKTNLFILIGLVAVVVLVAVVIIRRQPANQAHDFNIPSGQVPTIPPSAPSYIVAIHSIDASEISGTATFKDIAGTLAILVHIDGLEEDAIAPIELHHGTCASPGSLAYVLVTPDALEAETDLTINLKQFNTQKPMAVIVYESEQDRTIVACGDLP
jgi:hypothetical protein